MKMFDVTGAGDATAIYFNDCLGTIRGRAFGTPYDGTNYGRSCNTTFAIYYDDTVGSTVKMKAYSFRLVKEFPLTEVTAIGDTENK